MSSDSSTQLWLGKLTTLAPATGRGACRGKAPHKPLLVLSVIDMAEAGELPSATLTRTSGLVLRFRLYGALTAERWPNRLQLDLPFFHLSTQGFWQPFAADGRPAGSPETCVACELDWELFALLSDSDFRRQARAVLISTYFDPAEQIALFSSLGLDHLSPDSEQVSSVVNAARDAARRKGRCARFAVRVCSEYRFTCALTGYRCVTTDGASIVDAAHIEQWASSQNDEITNGLALSKSSHWMFDAGLWTISDDLRVIVNMAQFVEGGPEALLLASFHGRALVFDPAATLRPDPRFLRLHRSRYGRMSGAV